MHSLFMNALFLFCSWMCFQYRLCTSFGGKEKEMTKRIILFSWKIYSFSLSLFALHRIYRFTHFKDRHIMVRARNNIYFVDSLWTNAHREIFIQHLSVVCLYVMRSMLSFHFTGFIPKQWTLCESFNCFFSSSSSLSSLYCILVFSWPIRHLQSMHSNMVSTTTILVMWNHNTKPETAMLSKVIYSNVLYNWII